MKTDSQEASVSSAQWQAVTWSQAGTGHVQAQQACEDATSLHVGAGGVLSLAVADGVGGGARGDLASQAVARHWAAAPVPNRLDEALQQAGSTLATAEQALARALALEGEEGSGLSGSMLVGAWLFPSGDVILGHVGDCRAYRFRQGELLPLTRDHTYANLGLKPPPWRRPDHPARMLGGGMMGPPDVQRLRLQAGDLLLLCSDGVHAPLTQAALADGLRQAWQALPGSGLPGPGLGVRPSFLLALCRHLARQALAAGGQDDMGLALAWFAGAPETGASLPGETLVEADQAPRAGSDTWSHSVWPSDEIVQAPSETSETCETCGKDPRPPQSHD